MEEEEKGGSVLFSKVYNIK